MKTLSAHYSVTSRESIIWSNTETYLIMKPEQAGSYSTPHLTGVKRGGVCALQGSAKQLRLIDRANMRGQNWGRVGEGREGRAAAVLAACPAYLAKAPKSGTVANGRRDISAALRWDTVGRTRNTGGAVVGRPARERRQKCGRITRRQIGRASGGGGRRLGR